MDTPRKERNRRRILDAALRLLEAGDGADLTMRSLAKEAGVSEMTPYNLFGSKGNLLSFLLKDRLEELHQTLDEWQMDDPLDRLLTGLDSTVRFWTDPSDMFRKIIEAGQTAGVEFCDHAAAPAEQMEKRLQAMSDARLLSAELDAGDLARQVFRANQGTYYGWVNNDCPPAKLRRDLRLNLLIPLLAVARQPFRERLLAEIAALESLDRSLCPSMADAAE